MRLYIAGPMTGLPDMNYPAFFRAQTDLITHGYEVMNPAGIDHIFPKTCGHLTMMPDCLPCGERDWRWYMRKAIPMVCAADGIACLERWQNSRGAREEVRLARNLGMEVHLVYRWVMIAKEGAGDSSLVDDD